MRPLTKLVLCIALGLSSTAAARATARFDGEWSVRLTTRRGRCDPSYSWSVDVSNGRIRDSGMFVQTFGSIDRSGRVNLTMERGADVLKAAGVVRGQVGHGAWTSPTMGCSGAWLASRA